MSLSWLAIFVVGTIHAGAPLFVIGLSIWLRRFGPMARRAGSLIALPFVVLLTVPYIPPTPRSPIPAALVPVIIALLALLWVSAVHTLARRVRFLPAVREPLVMATSAPTQG